VIRKAILSFLRVCINLTNSNGDYCEYMNSDASLLTILTNVIAADPQRYSDSDHQHDMVSNADMSPNHEAEHEKKESRFELLLLSLGLMINFIQESDSVKNLVLTSTLSNDIKKAFEKLISRKVYHNLNVV